jgi:uncharacterized membrane protein
MAYTASSGGRGGVADALQRGARRSIRRAAPSSLPHPKIPVSVNFPILVVAVLLLLFPRNWMRYGARVGSKPTRKTEDAGPTLRDPRERSVDPSAEAGKSRNWIDLARGWVAGLALFVVALTPPEGLVGADLGTLSWQGLVLILAALSQMVRLEGRLSLFAPIFFLQGITFGAVGWLVGLLAMVGSWALTPVLPGPGAVLFVHGAFTLCLGLLFPGQAPEVVMLMVGVIWLPVLLSVLLKKRLSASFDKRTKLVSRPARERSETVAAGEDARLSR